MPVIKANLVDLACVRWQCDSVAILPTDWPTMRALAKQACSICWDVPGKLFITKMNWSIELLGSSRANGLPTAFPIDDKHARIRTLPWRVSYAEGKQLALEPRTDGKWQRGFVVAGRFEITLRRMNGSAESVSWEWTRNHAAWRKPKPGKAASAKSGWQGLQFGELTSAALTCYA